MDPRLRTLLLPLLLVQSALAAEPPTGTRHVMHKPLSLYVGTYTGKTGSKGIYRFAFDTATGRLNAGAVAAEAVNPSFLAVHPNRQFLYAVNESADFQGGGTGAVSAFAINATNGSLTLLNQQPSGGEWPCHLIVDAAGRNVLVANYGSGSIEVLPLAPDGRLTSPSCILRHSDPAPPGQPRHARCHAIALDASQRHAFVADLGLDRVFLYHYDAAAGTLAPNTPAAVALAAGSGPRHFAWHPSGRWAYVINELNSTVTAFTVDAAKGGLLEIQTLATLPAGFAGKSTCAAVRVHPSGRFLYGSNRGHDSIALFAVDAATGRLRSLGHEPVRGQTPRDFGIDPTGRFLLAANQESNAIVAFAIDPQTGLLRATDQTVDVPAPVCLTFL